MSEWLKSKIIEILVEYYGELYRDSIEEYMENDEEMLILEVIENIDRFKKGFKPFEMRELSYDEIIEYDRMRSEE